ncbi:bifunctional Ribosomal RNA large subunit methyltransferase E/Ribosomal RNA methyltransferase [Babesia duncani]|uniref:rRNA methyltransferase 2, mitochondrial n=1 Tax=Babesia duncani TaxID=323732 RepID=A0AAD9PNV7_9APIC|nr:bifunctional Ribosomal RNA large subunit methyltransferase E/Ribosomal RNA methyltransferase [Babesia duncani]
MRGFKVHNSATTHSADWIRRQITDRYTLQAQVDGYRSRSAYKLIQLDNKFFLFRKNQTVVEFGCYPGGWAQVALERTLAGASNSTLIGIDKIQMDPVISDLAPACTGIKQDDHLNSTELCMQAASLMENIIAVGGSFLVKIFMGSQLERYKTYMKSLFNIVNSAKPRACRSESKEMYMVCKGFIGGPNIRGEVQTQGGYFKKQGNL